jgi:hypothetical protein
MNSATNPTRMTFPVAGACYKAGDIRSCLTHSCELDADGSIVAVLCKRVKVASICEDGELASNDAPSCPVCAARLAKLTA